MSAFGTRRRLKGVEKCPLILGNTPFKYIAVHIVDKGAPLYDAPPAK